MVVATVAMSWSDRNSDQAVINQQNQLNESTADKSADKEIDDHYRYRVNNGNLLTSQAAVSQQQDQSRASDYVAETSAALNALVLNHRHRNFVASSPQKLDGDDSTAVSVTQEELDLITEWDLISPPGDEPTSPADEGVVLNSSVPCTDHLIVSSSSSAYSSAVSSISSPLSVSTTSNFISSYSNVEASVCKKRVRFADAHGKPLAQVCTFANSPVGSIDSANSTPVATTLSRIFNLVQAPQSTYCNGQQNFQNSSNDGDFMEMLFPDPLSSYSTLTERLRSQNVALESVCCRSGCIRGMIRVRNLSFSKHVFIRVTFDHWATSNDWAADYFPIISPSEGRSEYDLFEFSVPIPPHLMPGTIVDFCICYKCGDQSGEFWDNNGGNNYSLRYRPFTNLYSSQRRSTQPPPKQAITSQHLLLKTRTASELEAERAQRIRDFVWSEFASWNGGSALAAANPHQNGVQVMPAVRMASVVTSVSTSHAGQDMPLPYW